MEIWNVQEGAAQSPGTFHTAKQQQKIFLRGLFLVEIQEPTKCTCASAIWHCILRQIYIKKRQREREQNTPCRMWRSVFLHKKFTKLTEETQ